MIEIICNKDDSEKDEMNPKDSSLCIRKPKNIKQIGDVSSDKKIYIEDYAFTYINSIAYNNPEIEQAGVLLGEFQKDNGEKCVFVKGVIKAVLEDGDTSIHFNENIWNKIYSDIEKYFPNLAVVGWFAVVPEVTDERMVRLKKLHLDNFAGAMKTLYLVDTSEKEEHFYLYEKGALKKQKGYVCFYERNYEMQEYMLERNEKRTCEDAKYDKVVNTIRNVIKEKEELRQQKKSGSFMYGVSAFLVVVIIVIGINLMNNYDRMRKLNQSVNSLMSQLEGKTYAGSDSNEDTVTVNKLSGDVYPTEESKTDSSEADSTKQEDTASSVAATEGQAETNSTENQSSDVAQSVNAKAAESKADIIYTVKSGDTLMSICKKHYGTTSRYSDVMEYNHLEDGNVLYIGQEIRLPE